MSKELFQLQINEAKNYAEAEARQLEEFMQPMTDHAMYEVFNAQFNLLNQAIGNLEAIVLPDDAEGIEVTENPYQALITEAYAFNTTTFIGEHPLVEPEAAVTSLTEDLNQEHIEAPKGNDQAIQPGSTAGGGFMSRLFASTSSSASVDSKASSHAKTGSWFFNPFAGGTSSAVDKDATPQDLKDAPDNAEESKVSGDEAPTTEHPAPVVVAEQNANGGTTLQDIVPAPVPVTAPIVAEQNVNGKWFGSLFSGISSCGGCSSSAVANNAHAPQDLKGQQDKEEESKVSGDDAVTTEHPAPAAVAVQNADDTIIGSILGNRQLPPVLTPQPVVNNNPNATINATMVAAQQQQVDQYGLPLLGQPQGQSSLSRDIESGITTTDSVVLKLFDKNHDHDHDQTM